MSYDPETPFDSIEGSQEYVALLAEAIDEARQDVDADIAVAVADGAERRREALQLVSYNLAKLTLHITTSRRILNDLRTLAPPAAGGAAGRGTQRSRRARQARGRRGSLNRSAISSSVA